MKTSIAVALILAAILPGLAIAHAKIVSTVPADGDFVPSPKVLTLKFDNDVTLTGLELHSIAGVDAEGRTVEGDIVELEYDPETVARSFQIEVKEPLAAGEYYLLWRCVAPDSHFSTGEFFFTVISE